MSQHNFLSGTQEDLKRAMDDVNRRMQEDETKARAVSLGLPYIDLRNFPIDLNVLGIFSEDEAKTMWALPFYKDAKDLRLAVLDPKDELLQAKMLEFATLGQKVEIYLASKRSLEQVFKLYAKVLRPKAASDEIVRVLDGQNYIQVLEKLKNPEEQKKLPAGKIIETLFGAAMFFKASDIHLEPEEHMFKFRLRLDGVLQDMLHFEKTLQKSIITRLKIAGKLKLNVDNIPQDGRLTFFYDSQPVDVRISSLPSAYGEEFVMRILGLGAVSLKIADLGFRPEQQDVVQRVLSRPQGMIVTTGPTGSGKTTSLYAFLNQLNEPGVKIITLEDPVEYKLSGIVQTPIDHNVDFDFAKGLRAILRQDPDIVMVGEIRDQETAETAMQAALTGHMVLSTLHTNDSAGAIPRLLNMGIKPFVIAPALSAVLAQRLVRRICQACKKDALLSPQVVTRINLAFQSLPEMYKKKVPEVLKFFHSAGCAECHNLGYKGRVGVYEVLENTEKIQELIFKQASGVEFKKEALRQGMLTMLQDGLLKALEGITDVEEVFRVVGE